MAVPNFPTAKFCGAVVRLLDALEYDDYNLTRDERISGLREVHTKTVEYFAQPLPQKTLADVNPIRIATVSRTIAHFVVYCWSYVPRDVQVDISIYLSIINVLDDEINADPSAQMATFWTDLLAGNRQSHPFWVLMQAHLPQLLGHFGSYCSFNFMRCTIDYFQGCWIEQHNFQGWPGADCYPMFMRRLNCLGGAVAGTLFPTSGGFDEQALFKEISIVMAQIDGPVALVNDLFSFYKEYDQDEPNLVSNWCKVEGITMDEALERLADEALHSCVRILQLLKDKDPQVLQTIRGFIHGYVTWHFCELRYRVSEVHAAAASLGAVGAKFREYYEEALRIGWVELAEWSSPNSAEAMDNKGIEIWEKGSHFKGLPREDKAGSSTQSDHEFLLSGSPIQDSDTAPRGKSGVCKTEASQSGVVAPATQVAL